MLAIFQLLEIGSRYSIGKGSRCYADRVVADARSALGHLGGAISHVTVRSILSPVRHATAKGIDHQGGFSDDTMTKRSFLLRDFFKLLI
jgi:hypothetical protein